MKFKRGDEVVKAKVGVGLTGNVLEGFKKFDGSQWYICETRNGFLFIAEEYELNPTKRQLPLSKSKY